MTDNESDSAHADAARFIAASPGEVLLSEAERLLNSGAASHNALAHLRSVAGGSLPSDAARHAASLAWTHATLRGRAIEKFGVQVGSATLFDSDGLQMASGAVAADYHAALARRSGVSRIVDLTAGIGGDSVAFARAGMDVIAFEKDAARSTLLAANVERLGLGGKITVRQTDWTRGGALKVGDVEDACVYLDPPRRVESSRWGNAGLAEAMFEEAVRRKPAAVLMKLAPSVDRGFGGERRADLEFVSIGGECREAVLQWGRARAEVNLQPMVAAVLLPSGLGIAQRVEAQFKASSETSLADAKFLYEPDAAVIRAGFAPFLAEQLRASQFDSDIAYLISGTLVETPFATPYRVFKALPYHRRTVQTWLDQCGATQLIVKKRGVPDEPEVVRRLFKLAAASGKTAASTAILALTRQGKQRWAIFLERV